MFVQLFIMQNELNKDYSGKNERNDINAFTEEVEVEENHLLQSYFYEAAHNAINEIDLIYSDDLSEKSCCKNVILKIFSNIIENPENEKFFRLKLSKGTLNLVKEHLGEELFRFF